MLICSEDVYIWLRKCDFISLYKEKNYLYSVLSVTLKGYVLCMCVLVPYRFRLRLTFYVVNCSFESMNIE